MKIRHKVTAILTAALIVMTLLPAAAWAIPEETPGENPEMTELSVGDTAEAADTAFDEENEEIIAETDADQAFQDAAVPDADPAAEPDALIIPDAGSDILEETSAGEETAEEIIAAAPAPDGYYTREAVPMAGLPGVYVTKAYPGESFAGDNPATMGIPSIAKERLADHPTTESPAIIMGAAVNYETKTGPTEYTPLVEGTERVAPYSYFRHGVVDEQVQNEDGTITVHQKLSGFDGTYYIIRVDVSEIIAGRGENEFLHVRQESNKAMMVAYGLEGTTFSAATGTKTGSYSLADHAAALRDTGANDADKETPYFDVILMSSGKLAAGADAGQENAPSADVKLSFYVDSTADYNPDLPVYDAATMPTFPTTIAGENFQTEQDYLNGLLRKFFREENATAANNASGYLVKGSDLEIDVMVDEQESPDGVAEFWSLTRAMPYQDYDSHVVKLICEVPVLEGLSVESTDGSKRSVILDVNSFDIQIANNTEQNTAGLTIEKDAELRIMDGSNTSGAELAIGNNATMVVKKGGVMIIDETCTNEVEYDAATTVDPAQDPSASQFNGEITIEDGGTLINYGVVNIEGTEAKPIDPNQQEQEAGQTVITDMKKADMIVNYGGTFENYGCLSLKGILYVLGTLNNYGRYNDLIVAHDPDKGTTTYHKGIQVTWKDVVTREGVEPGELDVGIDADGNIESRAVLNNYGDIVIFPGVFNLYGTLNNLEKDGYAGHLYLCTVTEAIIPIVPTQEAPLVVEQRVPVDPPKESVFNSANGTVNNEGVIGRARVELIHNGVPGDLIPLEDPDPVEAFVTRLYNICLERDPDEAGLTNWVNQLKSGAITGIKAAQGFIFSQEFKNKNYCNRHFVQQLYRAFMGREPDEGGWNDWIGRLESGKTREEVFNGFALSNEFTLLCNDYGIARGNAIGTGKFGTVPTGPCQWEGCGEEDGVTAFVKRLYNVALNRDAEAAGLADWTGQLWAHTNTGKGVAKGFIFSAEFTARNLSNEQFVDCMYRTFFDRGADAAGRANWIGQLNRGTSRLAVFNGFANSQEFSNLCLKFGILAA